MRLYHRTSAQSAAAIFRSGFKDGRGSYMTVHEYTGVWLSDTPLDENEGAVGDTLLQVCIDGRKIRKFEWIEEGKPYREWLVPADLLNRLGCVQRPAEPLTGH